MAVRACPTMADDADEVAGNINARDRAVDCVRFAFDADGNRLPHPVRLIGRRGINMHHVGRKRASDLKRERPFRVKAMREGHLRDKSFDIVGWDITVIVCDAEAARHFRPRVPDRNPVYRG